MYIVTRRKTPDRSVADFYPVLKHTQISTHFGGLATFLPTLCTASTVSPAQRFTSRTTRHRRRGNGKYPWRAKNVGRIGGIWRVTCSKRFEFGKLILLGRIKAGAFCHRLVSHEERLRIVDATSLTYSRVHSSSKICKTQPRLTMIAYLGHTQQSRQTSLSFSVRCFLPIVLCTNMLNDLGQ